MNDDDKKPEPKVKSAPPVTRSVHEWRALKGTAAWAFAAASRGRKWSVGEWVDPSRITESDYDHAIHVAMHGGK